MKINVEKELGIKKDFEVKASNINVERALGMQLAMAKMDDTEDKEAVEVMQMTLDSIKNSSQYVKTTLKLNEKQATLVDEMEMQDTLMLVNRICMRIMGNSDEEIEKMFAESAVDGDLEKE